MAAVNQTLRAKADLQEIWDFVAQDNRDAADRVLRQVAEQARRYADNPELGSQLIGIELPLRYFRVGRYSAFYVSQSTGILIVRVLHEARHLPTILSEPLDE